MIKNNSMKNLRKIIILLILAFVSMIISISVGSVYISPKEIAAAFLYKIFNIELIKDLNKINIDIIFNIRFSHTILAFFTGASLSITGTIIQSILRNPLASTYNLGVSSGAGLGVSILIVLGINYSQILYIFSAIAFAFITIIIILAISKTIDKYMNNNSIILAGIIISLFVNSIMSFLTYLFPKYSNRIIMWQLGSLSLKNWNLIFIIIFITIIFLIISMHYSNVLDIMTFGDNTAYSIGINTKYMKIFFIIISSFVTSIIVSFVGIIGFIDLAAPHIARKLFSAKHILVIPMSALIGGILLVISDIISRIMIQGSNIPIGIITAVIGAPFFFYVFIKK